jgi:outer membrane protein OmpA-like peptidoglycan-associated protein
MKGCPFKDADGDGISDHRDKCPDEHSGPFPDHDRLGCPRSDRDGDGVFDDEDECPDVNKGDKPDLNKRGCPMQDSDGDTIPDDSDACPDKKGLPNIDPQLNGCPPLVEIKEGKLVILKPVFFARNVDVILPSSFKVLTAVANAILDAKDIKKVRIEGHTDDKGRATHNRELSQRRAESVRRFLVARGVAAERLTAEGFGPEKPIVPNDTEANRALNRRVEFRIIDPPPGGADPPPR